MFTLKDFNERMSNQDYRNKINTTTDGTKPCRNKKKQRKFEELQNIYLKTTKLINNKALPKHEVNNMGLTTLKQVKQKSDLNEEELELLTKIVTDKYSVGAFSGMIYNQLMLDEEQCPIKLVEKAIRVRKLIQDMAYQ